MLRIILVLMALTLSYPVAAQTEPASGQSPAKSEKLRTQLLTFAPYISMYNKLTLGQSKVADVLDELNKLKEFNDNRFDGSESLKRSSRDIFGFLVLSQSRITPALKDTKIVDINPALAAASPEFLFAAAMLELFAEAAKQDELRNWQADYDAKCRAAYRSLFSEMRNIAKGEKLPTCPITVIGSFDKADWVYLAAVNNSRKTLTNVTLRVKLSTIDGRSSEHFYFLDKWPAEKKKYPLRIAQDWTPGARATTSASVELISDEIIAPLAENRIDDHVPIAADLFLTELEKQIHTKKQLKIAIDRLEAMTNPVSRYPERAEKRLGLETRARNFLDDIIKDLDARITHEEKSLEGAKVSANRNKDSMKDHYKKLIDRASDEIKRLKSERIDYMSGKK